MRTHEGYAYRQVGGAAAKPSTHEPFPRLKKEPMVPTDGSQSLLRRSIFKILSGGMVNTLKSIGDDRYDAHDEDEHDHADVYPMLRANGCRLAGTGSRDSSAG